MTDAADRAQALEEEEREQALRRASTAMRRSALIAPATVKGRRVCMDCLEPIGRARLRAAPAALRCVECQTEHERRNRRSVQ